MRNYAVGADMAKCDTKSAFRLLPVHPADFSLLCFAFVGLFYTDGALPMGCLISCVPFECFSSFMEWALRSKTGIEHVVHYLDDFFVMWKEGN